MDIVLFGLIVMGLPALGVMIDLIVIQSAWNSALERMRIDDLKWNEKITGLKAKMIVIRVLPVTGVIFGFLIFIFTLLSGVDLNVEVEDKILLASGLAVGLSALFMCVGMAVLSREAVPNIMKDQDLFGKYLMLLSMPMTGAVYGLVCSLLLFMCVGMVGGTEVDIRVKDASYMLRSYLIFAGLCVFLILKGYLPTRVEGEMKPIPMDRKTGRYARVPDPVFAKKIIYAVVAEIPLVIGFMIIVISLLNKGLL